MKERNKWILKKYEGIGTYDIGLFRICCRIVYIYYVMRFKCNYEDLKFKKGTDLVEAKFSLNFGDCSQYQIIRVLALYAHFNLSTVPRSTVGNHFATVISYCSYITLNAFKWQMRPPQGHSSVLETRKIHSRPHQTRTEYRFWPKIALPETAKPQVFVQTVKSFSMNALSKRSEFRSIILICL